MTRRTFPTPAPAPIPAPAPTPARRALWRTVLDTGLAIGLAVVAVIEVWLPLDSVQGSGSREVSTVVAVVLCLALARRRRWPLPTALVVLLTWPIVFTIQPMYVLFWGQFVPMVVATYSVARYASRRGSLIGAAAAAACLLFFDFRVAGMNEPAEIVFHWTVITSAWVIGTVVRLAEQRAAASGKLAIETQLASRTRTLQAISAERTRIARELHDVVAHAVSIMVVQAGAAEQVVDDDPASTRKALENIRTTGADALTEMRRVVEMLRDADAGTDADMGADAAGDLHPQPGVAALPALIATSNAEGLAVRLRTEGVARPLTTGLDLAVYRIVQEALTNVRRHSGASRADVTLRYEADSVTVAVTDNGRGAETIGQSLTGAPAGNGMIGMRERVTLYGGSLEVDCPAGGGFQLRATLPVATS